MGGIPPLGYDVHERRLVVNPAEAETVRGIFRRYIELGCVRLLKNELDRAGIVSKTRIARNGTRSGGKPFSRGALYALLSNPVCIGEIRHKHDRYPGQHEAIVDRDLWARVHERLRNQASRRRGGGPSTSLSSALAGKLFDESGEPLYVQGATRGGRRYRYYVSRHLVGGAKESPEQGWRVPAPELERAVIAAAQQILVDRAALAEAVEEAEIDASQLPSVFKAADVWNDRLRSVTHAMPGIAGLSERVELAREGIKVSLRLPFSTGEDAASQRLTLTRFIPMQMKRRGIETRLVVNGTLPPSRVDLPLLKAVARGHRWSEDLLSGRAHSVREIARRERLSARYVWRVLRLGFLAPQIVEAIVDGRHPDALTAIGLTRRIDLPALWSAQEQALGCR